jgi:hypothetical protein
MLKLEPLFEQAFRDATAASEGEHRLGTHEEAAEVNQKRRRGRGRGPMQDLP